MRDVVWAPEAKKSYWNILDYLDKNWSYKEIDHFIKRTENLIDLIKRYPTLFALSETANVRKCLVVKQITLFYKVYNNRIELLLFWNNRQNPEKRRI